MGGFVLGSDYLGHRKHKTASLVLGDGLLEHGKNKVGGSVLRNDYLEHRKHKTGSFVLGDGLSEHGKNRMGGFVLGRKIASYFFYLCGMKTLLKILTIFIAIGAIGGSVMMWADPSGAGWGFNAMSNIVFVLGLAEAVLAVLCIRKG